MDNDDSTTVSDLEHFKKTALTRRQLAWQALKHTRNPEYVAIRYGYDVDTMREALAKIPEQEPTYKRLARSDYGKATERPRANEPRRASEFLPSKSAPPPTEREPGCDDDIGEDDYL